MAADGFVSLQRPDAGVNLVYLRTGLPTFKPAALAGHDADGLLVAFVVEAWGERYFQITDPNGVVLQLVSWVEAA